MRNIIAIATVLLITVISVCAQDRSSQVGIEEALFSAHGEGLEIFPADIQRKMGILAERRRVWFLFSDRRKVDHDISDSMMSNARRLGSAGSRAYILITSDATGLRFDGDNVFEHDLAFGGNCGHEKLVSSADKTETSFNQPYMPLRRAQYLMLRSEPPTEAELADLRDWLDWALSCESHNQIRSMSEDERDALLE